MSGSNVLEQMASTQGRLLDKLVTNDDLASLVMGLLGRLLYIAEVEQKKPVLGIAAEPWAVDGPTFKCRVTFGVAAAVRPSMWTPKNDFRDYAKMKAGSMAAALGDNPELGKMFQGLVEHVDQYAVSHGIPFKDLYFKQHIITPDFMIVLKVGRIGDDGPAQLGIH